ncbi:aldose epimerase family protein [Halobacillus litoralis]|uniref:aldose epimerase family protein n=1 Tax=Halobacillus litoralis TaxID=45668 RepID=UPI0024912140|nr:aldose epimerase family protein [Halobacillus litoralis]
MKIIEEELAIGWKQFTISNDHGMTVKALNYGGIIKEINVPDKHGQVENVVLRYQNDEDYLKDPNFFGAVIGRIAGRIDRSSFSMNGENYELEANDGEHHIHGGSEGFHTKVWETETFQEEDRAGLTLIHKSPHMDSGYPGELTVKVTYQLNNNNQLLIDYQAESSHDTVLTLTNHTYFNLSGNLEHSILNHEVKIPSRQFLELDDHLIPTGTIRSVAGTPFDFRIPAPLRTGTQSSYDQNMIAKSGYDHYFLFDHIKKNTIEVRDEDSGRKMTIHTDQPGVVLYTSNNLTDEYQLAGRQSSKYSGVCFETQSSPASLHHEGLPSVKLKAGDRYTQQTLFIFTTEGNADHGIS